jgi:glycosyltransferase involved in cell wall biosynthesis
MLSIIIPSRNEKFLYKTVESLLANARGEIEIIAVLDGYDEAMPDDSRVLTLRLSVPHGMRYSINSAVSIAKGEYILKCDAHCLFAEGFDIDLVKEMQDDWVMIPRRYSLDAENWCKTDATPKDYHYLCYPGINNNELHGVVWRDRAVQRKDILIDDEMSSQGSCWVMKKSYFQRMGFESEYGYGTFSQEFQEVGLKTWLSGGRVVINKKTWYAHLHKGKQYGRMWQWSSVDSEVKRGKKWSGWYWMNNMWKERKYDIEWLIDKFSPVPEWPLNKAEWKYEKTPQRPAL